MVHRALSVGKMLAATTFLFLILSETALSQLTFTPGWRTRILVKERSARSGMAGTGITKRQNEFAMVSQKPGMSSDDLALVNALSAFPEHEPWGAHHAGLHVQDRAEALEHVDNEVARACALLRDHLSRLLLLSAKKDPLGMQLHSLFEQVCFGIRATPAS